MRRFIYFVFVLVISVQLCAEASLTEKLKIHQMEVENRISKMESQLQMQSSLFSNANETIGNMLSSGGLLLAFVGFFVSLYITYMANRVENSANRAERLILEVKQINDTILKVQQDIDASMSLIYKKLQREEFQNVLERLERIPQDIIHFQGLFLRTEFPENYFHKLRKIILDLEVSGYRHSRDVSAKYLQTLLQHYPDATISDDDLWERSSPFMNEFVSAFYEQDAIKTSEIVLIKYRNGKLDSERISRILELVTAHFPNFNDFYRLVNQHCLEDKSFLEFIKADPKFSTLIQRIASRFPQTFA
ncbi:hypothetical protein EFP84_18845 [Leptospira kmetyi]|uniref:Uncharacterized protein n=1 Tax=Leptospira kmetyi TaxID=408139 RepID=A0AAD0XQT9_9LEPT|nr:hypothetical protein [Leptospira kmetyi]AYV57699.1 hypothetical protein EFP84_18845 [Leptospira kmetyi]